MTNDKKVVYHTMWMPSKYTPWSRPFLEEQNNISIQLYSYCVLWIQMRHVYLLSFGNWPRQLSFSRRQCTRPSLDCAVTVLKSDGPHLFFAGLLFIFSCLIKMGGGTPKQHPAEGEKGEETRKMMGLNTNHHAGSSQEEQDGYDMVPNPDADVVDLSELRGTRAPGAAADRHGGYC
jgi:hypothetical protein